MIVYRLSRKKYAKLLSGEGAAIVGGRWNAAGVKIIYTVQNRSLAMAEVAVHLTLATMPDDYLMLSIFIPDDISVKEITGKELPKEWNVFPQIDETKAIGDKFIFDNKFCVLKVPSAVTKGDYNLLLNPVHKDFKKIKIVHQEPFPFNKRLLQ
jgi:RES domain-containing protein